MSINYDNEDGDEDDAEILDETTILELLEEFLFSLNMIDIIWEAKPAPRERIQQLQQVDLQCRRKMMSQYPIIDE